jgi:tetratricopeptide (TPR) repeat protein
MNYSNINEMTRVLQLKRESKFYEALKLVDTLEQKQNLTIGEKFEIYFHKSSLLNEQGFFDKAVEYIELAIKLSKSLTDRQTLLDALIVKTTILILTLMYKEASDTITNAEKLLNFVTPNLNKEKMGYILCKKSDISLGEGDLNLALKYVREGFQLANEINNKTLLALFNELFGKITSLRGDFTKAIDYHKISLELAKEVNNKQIILCALNNIGLNLGKKEKFKQAIKYLKKSLSLCEEVNSYKTPAVLHTLCEIAIEIKAPEMVRELFSRFENFSEERDYKIIYGYNSFLIVKAMVLKTSQNIADKKEAKRILRIALKDENIFFQVRFEGMIMLCDLLLEELYSTNNIKIVTEIQYYLDQISNLAKSQNSFWILVEVNILQAKLKLIMFEFKQAQEILSQAYKITEKYDQNLLTKQILTEQEALSKNYVKWVKMKKSNKLISERMDLACIEEQIEILLQKRKYLKKINTSKQ